MRRVSRDRRPARRGARRGGGRRSGRAARTSRRISASAAGAEAIVAAALERHGRLDLLLNNAGGQYFAAAEAITAKGWRAVQRLNVGGTMTMSQAAYELAMRPQGAGTIVNVTVSPHHGMPAMAHTGAARAAVESITREQAERWAPDGVDGGRGRARAAGDRVTAQVPGRAVAPRREGRAPAAPGGGGGVRLAGCPARDAARPALSGSVVTLDGGLDNWPGPWPPEELTSDGEVPTEERRPSGADPAPDRSSPA